MRRCAAVIFIIQMVRASYFLSGYISHYIIDRYIDRVYIEGGSSRYLNATPPCTDADDLLRCSATVGNLGESGETDILT